jgi:hypothetical protein
MIRKIGFYFDGPELNAFSRRMSQLKKFRPRTMLFDYDTAHGVGLEFRSGTKTRIRGLVRAVAKVTRKEIRGWHLNSTRGKR